MGGGSSKSFSPKCSFKKSSSKSSKGEKLDYVEGIVCNEKDIKNNEMKIFPLGSEGGNVLLIKQKGELHALGTKCTHYGAPLNTGALGDGRIRCPWHGACFNITNGDIEDYPGLDSLPCYEVSVTEKCEIKVRAKRKDLENSRRQKYMCPMQPGNTCTAIIVGGGPSGATCAESLRQEGFIGRIVMICKETSLPYDRVKVSKGFDFKVECNLLRSQMFYNENKIETILGVEAVCLDTGRKIIKLSNNEEIKYTYLYIATGGKPRKPEVPGINLANIFVVRNFTDAMEIQKVLSLEKHVVILGGSFIGLESAAYCTGKSASVTIIGRGCIPLKPVFGDEIGTRIRKEYQSKGVRFIDNEITKFIAKEEDEKSVGSVEMKCGKILRADIVILGIGTTFYTGWLKGSPITMLKNGSIEVDEYLQTNVKNVFAGGDVAYAPVYAAGGRSATIGHFGLAHYHGKIAALNICGKKTPLRSVPFFWTMLFGKGFRYAGFGKATTVKINGSLDDLKFFAYHIKCGKVVAMSSVGRDPIVSEFANLLSEGKTLTEEEIDKDPIKWIRNLPKDLQKTPEQSTSHDTKS